MDFRIDPITGEPTVPLDQPWKRREWERYLRQLGERCLAEANERLGPICQNLPNVPRYTEAFIRRKRREWLENWKKEHGIIKRKKKPRRTGRKVRIKL